MRRTLPFVLPILFLITAIVPAIAQEDAWFYLRAKDTLFDPPFEKIKNEVRYTGTDPQLKLLLSKYRLKAFKKTYRNANSYNLKKTFL